MSRYLVRMLIIPAAIGAMVAILFVHTGVVR